MIAYIEPSGHYETIINYMFFFYTQKLKADFFLEDTSSETNFSNLNKKLFKGMFKILPIRQFLWKAKNYRCIIVGTTDYVSGGVNKVLSQFIDKVVAIYHTKRYIRDKYSKILVYNPNCIIDTRQLTFLPIHNLNNNLISKDRKELTTKIMFIGQVKYKDTTHIKQTLDIIESKYKNIVLHYFNRNERLELISNYLVQHIGYDDSTIQQYINAMDYLTIFPLEDNNSQYHNQTMSGTIPLAFNNNKPLIIDKRMNDLYNFKNTIVYDKNIWEVFDKITYTSSTSYNYLVYNIYNEKLEIMDNSWKNLDTYIKTFGIEYNYISPK